MYAQKSRFNDIIIAIYALLLNKLLLFEKTTSIVP